MTDQIDNQIDNICDHICDLIDELKDKNSLTDTVEEVVERVVLELFTLKKMANSVGPDGKEWPTNWWKSEDFESHKVGQISFVSDSI